mmetsp:Transcript_2867/g.4782  ORF Transcript_2867/g.4782 Transcript_2867/m.4782 type:complete len:204 (-) Transcript_2867:839-1450(-)
MHLVVSWKRPRRLDKLLLACFEYLNVPLAEHLLLEGEHVLHQHVFHEFNKRFSRRSSVLGEREHDVLHAQPLEEASHVPLLCRKGQPSHPHNDRPQGRGVGVVAVHAHAHVHAGGAPDADASVRRRAWSRGERGVRLTHRWREVHHLVLRVLLTTEVAHSSVPVRVQVPRGCCCGCGGAARAPNSVHSSSRRRRLLDVRPLLR